MIRCRRVIVSGTTSNPFEILLEYDPIPNINALFANGFLEQGAKRIESDREVEHHNWKPSISMLANVSNLTPKVHGAWQNFNYQTPLYKGKTVLVRLCMAPGMSHHRKMDMEYSTYRSEVVRSGENSGDFCYVTEESSQYQTDVSKPYLRSYYHLTRMWSIINGVVNHRQDRYAYTATSDGVITITDDSHTTWETVPSTIVGFDDVAVPEAALLSQGHLVSLVKRHTKTGYWKLLDTDWEDLSVSAVNGMKTINLNTSQYLLELREGLTLFRDLASIVKKPLDPKSWANAYLSTKWGTLSTLRDTEYLLTKASYLASHDRRKNSLRYSRSGKTKSYVLDDGRVLTYEKHLKIFFKDANWWAEKFIQKAMEKGLYPTFSNTWDFIPFSFLAGWVSNFPDIIEAIDAQLYYDYIDVVGCIRSEKKTIDLPASMVFGPNYLGNIRFVYYRRFFTKRAPNVRVPEFSLDTPNAANIIDGGALLVQRYR